MTILPGICASVSPAAMASADNNKWQGWVGHDVGAAQGNMTWGEFEPKAWEETDVDIQVTHSSVCGSDVHMLRNGWVSHEFSGPLGIL